MSFALKKSVSACIASVVIALTPCAFANDSVKVDMAPGLWDLSFTLASQSGEIERALAEAQKQLAALPPAQRKMVEDMMAAQGVGFTSGKQSIKVCMTQEQIDRGVLPQQDKNCKQSVSEISKRKYRVEMSCSGSSAGEGSGVIEFVDTKQFKGNFDMKMDINGKPEAMTMDQTGQWLSTDCGNIKPIQG